MNCTYPRIPSRFHGWHSVAATLVIGLVVMSFLALSSRPAFADHDEAREDCPDPITEGDSARMRVHMPGHDVERLYAFTTHRYYPADGDDFVQYHGVKMTSGSDSHSVRIPVITIEDDRPEKTETFAVGYWDDSVWHACEITIIDDDVPEVVNIQITSKPVMDSTYRANEAIDVTVTFTDQVDAERDALLSLFVGGPDESTYRGARYLQGSGTQHLTFRYRVQPGDLDPNGVSVAIATMDIDRNPTGGFSGRIFVKDTDVPVDYTHNGISSAEKHEIDGRPIALAINFISAPPDPWEHYRANQTIEVEIHYNVDVEINGDPTLEMFLGWPRHNAHDARREVHYLRGSGTDTLVFGYTIRPGDNDDDGVAISIGFPDFSRSGRKRVHYTGEGTIKARGTDVEVSPWYMGPVSLSQHGVDTTPPEINSVTIESQPENGEAYRVGETISLEVEFSESATIVGNPRINVDVGGTPRYATHQASADEYADSALFQYQVQSGDNDSDGIGLFANTLEMNGGNIYDRAGIGLGFTHTAIAADPSQKVDTSSDR